jgi:tripartite-type tricarboxylate transporter receptor subunit TctC
MNGVPGEPAALPAWRRRLPEAATAARASRPARPLVRLAGLALAAAALAPGAAPAQATAYPTRAVRIVVPYPPGGGTDVIARVIAQKMGEAFGQTVVVDNRPGANGIIGTDQVAKARPDGYTLLVTIATHAINPSLYAKLPFDAAKDLVPVTLLADYPYVIVVHPSLPARTIRDFIALAKARPGELAYASSGNGSGPHLGMELLMRAARIDLVHVPYKGAAPATVDLVSGQVQAMLHNFLAGLPMMRAGKLRPIAVTSAKRSAVMPDVATVAESGLPDYVVTNWYGMLATAGTPAPILARVQETAAAAVRSKEVSERLSGEGSVPIGSTPAAFAELLREETRKWADVIQRAGIRPENL